MGYTAIGEVVRVQIGVSVRSARLARCDCGTELVVFCTAAGIPIPEGCYRCVNPRDTRSDRNRVIAATTHGHWSRGKPSTTYKSWEAMLDRCNRDTCSAYPRYGGRGIYVCAAWQRPGGFERFLADLGEKPPGTWLEREDNDGSYVCGHCEDCVSRGIAKTNCSWKTPREQGGNKSSNHFITVNGERLHVTDWARRLGTESITIHGRLRLGWTEEAAVTTPVRFKDETIEANGEALPISEWAARLGTTTKVIKTRIARGLAPAKAVTTPLAGFGGPRGRR